MARPQRQWRMSVRHWRVRLKLAAVLIVPSVAFAVIGGVDLAAAVQSSRALQAYADGVALAREVTALVHPLQRERDSLAGLLVSVRGASRADARARLVAATAEDDETVDQAVARYRDAAQGLAGRQDAAVAQRFAAAADELTHLSYLRRAAVEGQLRDDAVFDGYTRLIGALLHVLPDSAGAGEHPDAERRVGGLLDLMQVIEVQSQVRGRLFATASAGGAGLGDAEAFADLRARRTAALDRFRAEIHPAALTRFEETVRGAAVLAVTGLERSAADHPRGARRAVDADRWWLAATAHLDLLRAAEEQFVTDAIAATTRLHTDATARARAMALRFALIALVAIAAWYVVGRSLSESLRRLRGQALIVANHTLPDAIRRLSTAPRPDVRPEIAPAATGATDEVGEVAEAFDAVHRSALRLAVEQATLRRDVSAMFTNLARRSQLLVERQLRVLDEMEANEQDPDRLAQLFALDHLTARLRRNDENLLVLAAEESRPLWREPALLSRVLLGALAETEQYQRVRLAGPDDALVAGHVVPDLIHLLAELLDNATAFSSPSATVEVTSTRAGDGMDITICDSGMGMTRSMLGGANAKLAAPPAIDVAFSEHMGLFVVSHLAARHGMRVELSTAPRGGVQAAVSVPGSAFDRPEEGGGTDTEGAPPTLAERLAAGAPPAPAAPATQDIPLLRRTAAEPGPASLGEHRRGVAARPRRTSPAETATGDWWSGGQGESGGGWFGGAEPPSFPAQPQTGGVTAKGLPVRVPRANAPARPTFASREAADPPSAAPAEVGTMLARFHTGVRRADTEEAPS